MLLLGTRPWFCAKALTPSPTHQAGVGHAQLLADVAAPEGLAALRAAFPTPAQWAGAGPDRRSLYWQARVQRALTPPVKKPRVPVRTPVIATLLGEGWIACEALANLEAYDQRCRDAIATGLLSPEQDTATHAALAEVQAACKQAEVRVGRADTMRDRRSADQIIRVAILLGAKGYGHLTDQVDALTTTTRSPYNTWGGFYDQGAQALLSAPSPEGLAWLARTTPHAHHAPMLLQVEPAWPTWAHDVIAGFTHDPHHWQGHSRHGYTPNGLLVTGMLWYIPTPDLRLAWLRREAAKPKRAWSISAQDLAAMQGTSTPWHDIHRENALLVGAVRLSLAIRDNDTAWLAAFGALAQRATPTGRPTLLSRWGRASGHARLRAHARLGDTEALVAMEGAQAQALLAEALS